MLLKRESHCFLSNIFTFILPPLFSLDFTNAVQDGKIIHQIKGLLLGFLTLSFFYNDDIYFASHYYSKTSCFTIPHTKISKNMTTLCGTFKI